MIKGGKNTKNLHKTDEMSCLAAIVFQDFQ